MQILTLLSFFSAFSFVFFGISAFVVTKFKIEFIRYGLPKLRGLVGCLELLGAAGLILGHFYAPLLQALSAVGLCLLMILGFLVRIKIKDSFLQAAPSLFYAVLNALIVLLLWPSL